MSREDACSDIAAVQAHLLRGLCVGMVSWVALQLVVRMGGGMGGREVGGMDGCLCGCLSGVVYEEDGMGGG